MLCNIHIYIYIYMCVCVIHILVFNLLLCKIEHRTLIVYLIHMPTKGFKTFALKVFKSGLFNV